MADIKYGLFRGPDIGFPILMTDAEVIKDKSGRFLTRNASTGYGEIADTTEDLIGWAESEAIASTSSNTVKCLYSLDAAFRLPLIYDNSTYNVNYSAAILFEGCDLKVSSSVQYADTHVATNKSIMIIGGQAATGTDISPNDGYIEAIINPNARLDLGVGA